MNRVDHEELMDIHEKMMDLAHSAEMIMRREGGIEYERAKGYWLANIKMGLTKDHGYLSNPMFTMQSSIDALSPCEDDTDEEEEQDDEGDFEQQSEEDAV
jgi:hypothetical protein